MNSPANPQAKRHIGQILIDQGILTEDQLRIALLEQTKSHVPVGRLLVQLGFVSEATLRDALSEKLGLQSVDLAHIIVDPAALKMLPRDMARRQCSTAYFIDMPCSIWLRFKVMSNEVGRRNQSSMYCMMTAFPMPLRWCSSIT